MYKYQNVCISIKYNYLIGLLQPKTVGERYTCPWRVYKMVIKRIKCIAQFAGYLTKLTRVLN